jgi:lysophospholipase L1-like esterase
MLERGLVITFVAEVLFDSGKADLRKESFSLLEKVAGDPHYNLADGIHPNEEGHKIIAESIYQAIQDLL